MGKAMHMHLTSGFKDDDLSKPIWSKYKLCVCVLFYTKLNEMLRNEQK